MIKTNNNFKNNIKRLINKKHKEYDIQYYYKLYINLHNLKERAKKLPEGVVSQFFSTDDLEQCLHDIKRKIDRENEKLGIFY